MKVKILLGLLIINLSLVGIYLAVRPAPVAAVDTQTTAKNQTQPILQQPIGMTPADQVEIIRQKEERLKAREKELKELEQQVQEKIARLEAVEAAIKADLAAYRFASSERIKHLVKIYSSMKPGAAATLMNNLDTDVAVEVFLGLKGDVAGGILSYMEPVKAATITQRLVSYRGAGKAPSAEAAPRQ
jgi:flagellar motility protein MotE (MotC chaperone)